MEGILGFAALGIAILLFVGANLVAVAFMLAGPGADRAVHGTARPGPTGTPDGGP